MSLDNLISKAWNSLTSFENRLVSSGKTTIYAISIPLILALGGEVKAAIYYANPGQSIQSKIDDPNVVAGDEIVVSEGRYYENINFRGKNIVLRSTNPNNLDVVAKTIIDGGQNGPVVTFNSGEDANCVLSGFTITNGLGVKGTFSGSTVFHGGGVYCNNSSPIIAKCDITNNKGDHGAGIFVEGESSPIINNCNIIRNTFPGVGGGYRGGGIYCWGGLVTITNCLVSENNGAGIWGGTVNLCEITKNGFDGIYGANTIENSTVSYNGNVGIYGVGNITNCMVIGNQNSGISVARRGEGPTIANCTIVRGQSNGLSCGRGNTTLINSIVRDNMDKDVYVWNIPPPPSSRDPPIPPPTELTISYSDIEKIVNEDAVLILGAGNINADPCFANPNNDDYHLKSQAGRYDPNSKSWIQDNVTSPCIDAGNPQSPIGYEPFPNEPFPNGGIINIGAYGGTAEASKSYFGKPNCETIVAGDINGDCKVDFKDFAFISLHWLEDNNK